MTVINDLNYDQRMIRICRSLAAAGYDVELTGRSHRGSKPLQEQPFRQKRLAIGPEHGKMMYFLYWLRLFWYLLFRKADALCAIDLDTILPVYFVSCIRGIRRVYDAHELFTEMQEVVTRPREKKLWDRIERFTVPRFPVGYTIGECYAAYFREKYQVQYEVVRNATVLRPFSIPEKKEKFILYQGAVNIGRCFEYLIPAMQHVDAPLIICGDGNFFKEAVALVKQYGLEDKVSFRGYVPPDQLREYTRNAWAGITLFEAIGPSNRLSMANRFFDYMHSGVPQLCMAYPEYEKVNTRFELACLIETPTADNIAEALNRLIHDEAYHQRLEQNAMKAREVYCWQEEEKRLKKVYEQLFSTHRQ
ncbi:glycosyltransferase family 4 protein [Taibaiella helva]|uniref:glycosyltransferase family 4 protein n=1 Tax=Taibaiella helva TaxID=2301235 RepID=UPI001E3DEB1C|nr:glycosyltransferase family 4 protein [Taibaiella helva]